MSAAPPYANASYRCNRLSEFRRLEDDDFRRRVRNIPPDPTPAANAVIAVLIRPSGSDDDPAENLFRQNNASYEIDSEYVGEVLSRGEVGRLEEHCSADPASLVHQQL